MFPAIAMTAVAQTTSPANAKAEKALRARAEEFYKLELSEDFRHAEALVAEDSKDYFYNSGKPKFKGATVGSIEFTDKGTRAIVHVDVKVELMAPGVGAQVFGAPSTSTWKLEHGKWVWYFNKESTMVTPFGKMTFAPGDGHIDMTPKVPGLTTLESLVTIDRQSLVLTTENPEQTVTVSNGLPGPITLALGGNRIEGLVSELEKTDIKAGEKAVVRFRRVPGTKPSGTVLITASPLSVEFEIQVKSE